MEDSKLKIQDGIATAADFRQKVIEEIFEAVAAGSVQTVRLPSRNLLVVLRHPGPLAAENLFREYQDLLDGVRQEKGENDGLPPAERKYEASLAFQDFLSGILRRVFVQPAFGVLPGDIQLRHILPDFGFISRWLGGEVVTRPDGSVDDLKPFPGQPEPVTRVGVDGATQPVPAERAVGAAGNAGVPD